MKYILEYRVWIEADDFEQAELMSIDLEGDIKGLHKWIKDVDCDPYMEEVE